MRSISTNISNRYFLRFVIVGLCVLTIENVIIWQLMYFIENYLLVRAIASISSLFLAYVLNTHFSFSSTHSFIRFVSYIMGISLSLSVSYMVSLVFYYLVFASSWPLLSTNFGAIAAAIANFLYQKNITYRKK
jgi:putative flippase GtrA